MQIKTVRSAKKETQHFFHFRTRIKVMVILALVITLSSSILALYSVATIRFPPGNSTGSRFDVIEGDTYLRISIGTGRREWLLLSVTTNVSSDFYVRGTEIGDMRLYDSSFIFVKCGSWFIVTVYPSDACFVQFEWTSYNRTEQFDIASYYISQLPFLLIMITVAFDAITVIVVLRNRLEVVE